MIEYEQEERRQALASGTLPDVEDPTQTKSEAMFDGQKKSISLEVTSMKSKREQEHEAKLPEIGSFRLIQDIVNELQFVNQQQKELEDRQDLNSKRAFHNRAKALVISFTKSDDPDRREILDAWGGGEKHEGIGTHKQLRRTKGLCHTNTERFNTSTKEWLKNQKNFMDERDKPATERRVGQLCATGQAMFNLNRTLPKPDKDTWNANIRKNIATQRGHPSRVDSANTYNRMVSTPQLGGSGHGARQKPGLGNLFGTAKEH